MCGLLGFIGDEALSGKFLQEMVKSAYDRGKDSSGLLFRRGKALKLIRSTQDIRQLVASQNLNTNFILGHGRLITNGLSDNQPIVRDNVVAFHNGIVLNHAEIWKKYNASPNFSVDTEIINFLASYYVKQNKSFEGFDKLLSDEIVGTASIMLYHTDLHEIYLYTNNRNLFVGENKSGLFVSSERQTLERVKCKNIKIPEKGMIIDVKFIQDLKIDVENQSRSRRLQNLIPNLNVNYTNEKIFEIKIPNLRRCTNCILPETFPYIKFDNLGVCNYCHNYKSRNAPKPRKDLENLLSKYSSINGTDCIVPFSGGRDSTAGLHLLVKEFGMSPVTYTYDWGMVTDLGRRNISKMCDALGVENIIFAANIESKRINIQKNLIAFAKRPHPGLISLLTAGDKHFFKYLENVKIKTGLSLNIWSVNPLEVTHFKNGFLGLPPDFEENKVYSNGILKQLKFHKKRFGKMLSNPQYLNHSLFDTLSGEYYRSIMRKTDYVHLFDYIKWDETEVNNILEHYDWEKAPDTNCTWRIGDGTAAFYNFYYYKYFGFTEHDTFRSNQIREGMISREKALDLVKDENKPRIPNIKWYFETVGLDYVQVLKSIEKNHYTSGFDYLW